MLDIIAWFFLMLSHWHDSCACHDEDTTAAEFGRSERQSYYRARAKMAKCAMNGRRAPDMASGAMAIMVRNWLHAMQNVLLIELAAFGVGPGDRGDVMADFNNARRHIWMYFELKFSFWLQLPWALMGTAHHRLDVAWKCARRCLQLRDASAQQPGDHFWTVLLLVGHVGRAELTRFAYDLQCDLSELPLLQTFIGIFMFAYTSERWVESLHAISKNVIQTAHHVGPVHIAFHAIQTSLKDCLSHDAGIISELAQYAASTRNPYDCVKAMRLRGHAAVQDCCEGGFWAGTAI